MCHFRVVSLAFVWLALVGPGCREASTSRGRGDPTNGTTGVDAGVIADGAPLPGLGTAHGLPAPPTPLAAPHCRATAVSGTVRAASEDAGLAAGAEIPSEAWLVVSPGARIASKDPRTTREVAFYGPAFVRPCVAPREEAWLSAGTVESEQGAGEVPGAEEWIVTPYAVVRYNAAHVRVSANARETSITLGSGTAFAWFTADVTLPRGLRGLRLQDGDGGRRADANGDGDRRADTDGEGGRRADADGAFPTDEEGDWVRLAVGSVRAALTRPPAPLEAAKEAASGCEALAGRAHELTSALLEPADPEGGAASVVAQVRTRRLARAACSLARLRVALLPASPDKEALVSTLDDADQTWMALPRVSGP